MLAVPHATTGAAIAVATGNPVLGFLFAFVSHFVGDRIPHTEATTFYGKAPEYWKERFYAFLVDFVLMVIVVSWLWSTHPRPDLIFWGFLGGIGPDIVTNIPWVGDRLKPYWGFRHFNAVHYWAHYQLPKRFWPLGVATQVVVLAVTLGYLVSTR